MPGKTASVPENEEETGVEVQEALPLPSFVGNDSCRGFFGIL